MDAKHATPMYARRTVRGFVPARPSTLVARSLSMLCLLRAAARVKPPTSSMIVGLNIWEKMYLVASGEVNLLSLPSLDRMIRRTTTSRGTESEVTKRGITCTARFKVHPQMARQRCLLQEPKTLKPK